MTTGFCGFVLAAIGILVVTGWLSVLHAGPVQITVSGSYSQDFDSLPTSGTSNPWNNDVTLPGWHAEQVSGAISTIRAGICFRIESKVGRGIRRRQSSPTRRPGSPSATSSEAE